jgi:hypothetical protein
LRRARTDKRARRALLVSAGGLAALAYYPLYLWFTFRHVGIWGFVYFYAPILLLALVAGWLMRRSHRRADEMIAFSITGREPSFSGLWKPNPEVAKYMADRAKILSAMLLRGMGEVYIHRGAQPNGVEPRVRPGRERCTSIGRIVGRINGTGAGSDGFTRRRMDS